jgi:MoxR-like ATPase
VGKSSLAHAIAYRMNLGKLLVWPISTKSTMKEGLYGYDAIARLQAVQADDADAKDIGKFITLGALGTALHPDNPTPRVVLVDEIDKSDVDLPNDLLNVLEEGSFDVPELRRLQKKQPEVEVLDAEQKPRRITNGVVSCPRNRFPVVVLTSNGEREFPAPFLRRCIRLTVKPVTDEIRMASIVKAHKLKISDEGSRLIREFIATGQGDIATDQLLNAIFILAGEIDVPETRRKNVQEMLMRRLTGV